MEKRRSLRGRKFDSSIELLKIQIFSERAHARLITQVTNTYALLMGFVAFFYTLLYENAISLSGFTIGLAVFLAGTIYETYHVRQVFKKDVKRTSVMMETVKQGKELPKLEELVD